MTKWNFIVVGSGGGGGTIAWLLAKRGFSVLLLEQGADPLEGLDPKAAFAIAFQVGFLVFLKRANRRAAAAMRAEVALLDG